MIKVRSGEARGHFDPGWLNTYHMFSFADYYDPANMGFRSLRVINEDWVHPGHGFGTHPHRDMEIVTYVLEGGLAHKDSMGNGSTILPGDVQRMSAGTGVLHSEFNHSENDPVHLLQIWILPERRGIIPSYEQKNFTREQKLNHLRLLASHDGREGSVKIHQDAQLYTCVLEPGNSVEYVLKPNRHAWVQVAKGSVDLNGQELKEGDGAAVSEEANLNIKAASQEAEVLVFDLA